MAEIGIAIVSSVSAGGFALLGVGLADSRARRREIAAFRTETALELAGMERRVWGEDWVELRAHIERQRARMTVADVPDDLIDLFEDISHECWRDRDKNLEQSNGEHPAISTELLDARQAVHRALRAYLLRQKGKNALAEEATRIARDALADRPDESSESADP